jgi:hypothetical protein
MDLCGKVKSINQFDRDLFLNLTGILGKKNRGARKAWKKQQPTQLA